MLSLPKPRRKPSSRSPFLVPLWDHDHPAMRRIEPSLPGDHHARWLVAVVHRLDLTALRLSYAGRGSLAYPVELLLAFVLWMYSEAILSPAEWARQARYDDRSKWLLRGLQPSRSQLYTFRDRVEPFLDDWHRQLIAWAILEGITAASRASLDGTFVASLASRHHLMSRRAVARRLLLLRLAVWVDRALDSAEAEPMPEELLAWVLLNLLLGLWLLRCAILALLLGRLPAWMPSSVAGRRRVLGRYEQAQLRLTQRLQPYLDKKKPLSKKEKQAVKRMRVSLTDPDAALGWDKAGTYRPLYNVPLVQATDAPLTLAWDVLPRNNDDGLLKPMMQKTKEQLGRNLDGVLVDGAFVNVGDAVWCEAEGIVVYGPPERAKPVAAEADKPRKLPKKEFRYDAKEKAYYCPEGKRLDPVSRRVESRLGGTSLPVIIHQAAGKDCSACVRRGECTSNPEKGRVVKHYEGEEVLARLEERMKEPASLQAYKQRGQSVELGYADLKEHRGLRVFRGFGRPRARAQAGLVILASNGLKVMHALRRREMANQPPAAPEKQAG